MEGRGGLSRTGTERSDFCGASRDRRRTSAALARVFRALAVHRAGGCGGQSMEVTGLSLAYLRRRRQLRFRGFVWRPGLSKRRIRFSGLLAAQLFRTTSWMSRSSSTREIQHQVLRSHVALQDDIGLQPGYNSAGRFRFDCGRCLLGLFRFILPRAGNRRLVVPAALGGLLRRAMLQASSTGSNSSPSLESGSSSSSSLGR